MKTFLLAALSLVALTGAAAAQQAWPAKPVTIIVPFSAGGTTDQFGRLLGQHMQQTFGQPFVVENKPGAGGNIGAGQVAKGPKDGHMLSSAQSRPTRSTRSFTRTSPTTRCVTSSR